MRGLGAPVGGSPYVQLEGFVEEGVQLVPLALGVPGHHLGELVPGLQGELHEGVAGAWWGADISPLPWPLCPAMNPAGGLGHTGAAAGWGSGQPHHNPQPSPGSWRVREHPKPCPHSDRPAVAAGGVTSPGELPKRQPDREKVAAHSGVFFLSVTALHDEEKQPALAAGLCHKQWDVGTVSCMVLPATSH